METQVLTEYLSLKKHETFHANYAKEDTHASVSGCIYILLKIAPASVFLLLDPKDAHVTPEPRPAHSVLHV